jgi:hypothetical protein
LIKLKRLRQKQIKQHLLTDVKQVVLGYVLLLVMVGARVDAEQIVQAAVLQVV